jgi:hypothetical protein
MGIFHSFGAIKVVPMAWTKEEAQEGGNTII